jgi:AcrR family transcriptional regulator
MESGLRERKNVRTREAIQRAAYELALDQGFDRTTVEQIAERAEVAPRTVYVRFPTKDSIVFAAEEASSEGFAKWLAGLEEFMDRSEGDVIATLIEFVRMRTEVAGAQSELAQLRRRALLSDPYLRRAMRGRYEPFERAIAERVARDLGLPADDTGARAFAGGVFGVLSSVAQGAVDDPDGFDATRDCASGLRFLRAGLEALREDATD